MNDIDDLRAIHSRITDGEDTIELHSADIAAIIGHIQALTKRVQVCEEMLALHCGIDEGHAAHIGGMVVPGD